MKLYNSLTRRVEIFTPIKKGKIGMYVCGPTVNGPSHLGHASTYISFDIIRRALEYLGYNVKLVVNLTDVHDDMIKVANERGITIFELAKQYINLYMQDLKSLHILSADVYPRVTEHIDEIIAMVKKLQDREYAYETDDGVYFDVANFSEYGKLSGIKVDKGRSGERVETDKYDKENVADFALWKKAREGEPSWDSPWGKGRPGWHIECSVMAEKYLGQPFDIHGGGLDLKFPHHENEIAQSEAANGKQFVNYWMHAGLLKVDGQKMSNSLGNFIVIPDVLKKYDPMVLRYWRATVQYRSEINYSDENMDSAKVAFDKLSRYVHDLKSSEGKAGEINVDLRNRFVEALEDDFNMPKAIAVLWDVVKSEDLSSEDKLATVLDFDRVFGLGLKDTDEVEQKITEEMKSKVERIVRERDEAREKKNWDKADELRGELDKLGVVIEDTDSGTVWRM